MNFLLKIVEGPNKGAEIALVEDVAVTVGKADDCDVILADPTLPDAPFTIKATASGVTFDDEQIEPYHVKSVGSTAFAVGPSGSAWDELVWPQPEKAPVAEGTEAADAEHDEKVAGGDTSSPPSKPKPEAAPKRRRGCLGCILWPVVLLLILLGLAWFFRDALRPRIERLLERAGEARPGATEGVAAAHESVLPGNGLQAVAAKYGLSFTDDKGRTTLSGNFRTRAERLAATAEAYECQPGAELDLSDDESFATAAMDGLFTLTEGRLKVAVATNRFLSIVGSSPSAGELTKILGALNADLPKLRGVDIKGVSVTGLGQSGNNGVAEPSPGAGGKAPGDFHAKPRRAVRDAPFLPVCGILTTPYPCLVLQNGQRVLEGATIGEAVILKIAADSVVVTNANGRFVWKP